MAAWVLMRWGELRGPCDLARIGAVAFTWAPNNGKEFDEFDPRFDAIVRHRIRVLVTQTVLSAKDSASHYGLKPPALHDKVLTIGAEAAREIPGLNAEKPIDEETIRRLVDSWGQANRFGDSEEGEQQAPSAPPAK